MQLGAAHAQRVVQILTGTGRCLPSAQQCQAVDLKPECAEWARGDEDLRALRDEE